MSVFVEIADLARLLAKLAPKAGQDYVRVQQNLEYCRNYPEWNSLEHSAWHNLRCAQQLADECREELHKLATLCYQHLPGFSSPYVRINPDWRFDSADTPWAEIVAELRRIEDVALQALLAPEPPTGEAEAGAIPNWNRDTGELTVGGTLAKRIKNTGQAVNVVRILNAFQEDGWPVRIDDPLLNGRDPVRLRETIKSLNRNLSLLRFSPNGTGESVVWKRLE